MYCETTFVLSDPIVNHWNEKSTGILFSEFFFIMIKRLVNEFCILLKYIILFVFIFRDDNRWNWLNEKNIGYGH